MSRTIDEKVVEMKFDNSNFEQNVKQSMNSMERLKSSLNFDGTTKNITSLNKSINDINVSPIGSAIESVQIKFSALEIAAMTVVSNITTAAINAGKNLYANTLGQIKSGGYSRALNIEQAKFQLKGLGVAWDDISEDIDYGVKDTAYGLDAAAKAASQLVASQVKFGKKSNQMKKALRGISGVAAMTNSSYEDIANIFTRIAGNGRLYAVDLQSFASRGLNAAATLGKHLGKTEAQIREMVSKGKIDFKTFADAMDSAFGQHAKDANQTFTGAMSNVRAALSRIGQRYYTQYLENMILLLNKVREKINEFNDSDGPFAKMMDWVNKLTKSITKKLVKAIDGISFGWMNDVFSFFKTGISLVNQFTKGFEKGFKQIHKYKFVRYDFPSFKDWLGNGMRDDISYDKYFNDINKKSTKTMKFLYQVAKIKNDVLTKDNPVEEYLEIMTPFQDMIAHFKVLYEEFKKVISTSKTFKEIINVIGKILGRVAIIATNVIGTIGGTILELVELIKPSFGKISDWVLKALTKIDTYLFKLDHKIRNNNIKWFVVDLVKGLSKPLETLGKGFSYVGNRLQELFNKISKNKAITVNFKNFFVALSDIASSTGSVFSAIGSMIGKVLTYAFDTLINTLEKLFDVLEIRDFHDLLEILSELANTGLLYGISKMFTTMSNPLTPLSKVITNLKLSMQQLFSVLKAYTMSINAEILFKIAKAIAILAGSLWLLSSIEPDRLVFSIGSIVLLFHELMTAFTTFASMQKALVPTAKGFAGMFGYLQLSFSSSAIIKFSVAVGILALATKLLSTIDFIDAVKALASIELLMFSLQKVTVMMAKIEKPLVKTGGTLLAFSFSILIISSSMKLLSTLNWSGLAKSMIGLAGITIAMTSFAKTLAAINEKTVLKGSGTLISFGFSMLIMASSLKLLSTLDEVQLVNSLTAMTIVVSELLATMYLGSLINLKSASSMIVAATSLLIVAQTFKSLAKIEPDKLITIMFGISYSLLALSAALIMMNGTMNGAASLLVASISLEFLTGVLKKMSEIKMESLVTSILNFAVALSAIVIAAVAVAPFAPAILTLATALMSLAGVAVVVGVGLIAIGIGLSALGVGITTFVVGLKGLIGTIGALFSPLIKVAAKLGKILGTLVVSVINSIIVQIPELLPKLIEYILTTLINSLTMFAEYIPQLVDILATLLIDTFKALEKKIPELISSFISLVGTIFNAFADAMKSYDSETFKNVITGAGLLAALTWALSSIVPMIPAAMIGVVGVGLIAAELSAVFAALGALSRIPGILDLVSDGGNLMQAIGTALGQFVGGILAGVTTALMETLPDLATNLSLFMTNLLPFIEGAQNINPSIIESIAALAGSILIITGAEFLNGIDKFLSLFSGKSSIDKFSEDLIGLAQGLMTFSDELGENFDPTNAQIAASALESLAMAASNIPNSGGLLGAIFGDNDVDDFASQLVVLAEALVDFSSIIEEGGINEQTISSAVSACNMLSAMADSLPNSGGLLADIVGDNTLSMFAEEIVPFGKGIVDFVNTTKDVVNNDSVDLAKKASEMVTDLLSVFDEENTENIDTTALDDATDAINEVFGMAEKVNSKSYKTKIKNIFDSVIQQISDFYNDFKLVGSNLMQGFADGMLSKEQVVYSASAKMAQKAIEACEKTLDEHSPSKVMYGIGSYAGDGFVNALNDYQTNSYNAGYNMATAARNGLSKAVDKINDFIDSGMDTTPIITPVVDLSNVSESARYMSSMFGSSIDLAATSQIGSTFDSTIQNGNSDVIDAIEKLNNTLAGVNSNTYNINGITYDSGSDVASAIDTLVRAAVVGGRI